MLDISKLTNVKVDARGWSARCPFCASAGADKTGNHLHILKSGKFSCIIAPGDKEHNAGILRFVGGDTSQPLDTGIEYKATVERLYELDVLDRLIKDYSYWENRGISQEILEPLRGGVATEAQLKDRFVFPIFREDGKIIGFSGRTLKNADMKYKHIGKVSTFIYGDVQNIKANKRVVLLEGISDYLYCHKYGIKDCLVLFGINISHAIIGKLIELNPSKIFLSLNNDDKHEVGQKACEKIKTKLDKFFNDDVVSICLPEAKDFGECTADQITKWKTEANYL